MFAIEHAFHVPCDWTLYERLVWCCFFKVQTKNLNLVQRQGRGMHSPNLGYVP